MPRKDQIFLDDPFDDLKNCARGLQIKTIYILQNNMVNGNKYNGGLTICILNANKKFTSWYQETSNCKHMSILQYNC